MSKNLQTDANDTKLCACDDQVSINGELQQTTMTGAATTVYDKQHSLVEKANITFLELCKTLENEQTKLLELEEKRKKLQEEMLLLKAEIEEEKQSFNFNIVESVAENLSALNKAADCDLKPAVNENLNINNLYTCYEDEEHVAVTARNVVPKNSREFENEEPTIQEHVQNIRN
ncbi:uncharacterized protein LOC135954604 isoform X2 [Calliphora vicina]|uniref:uncharacterized protein LOC135954604 isoform X2 n=1 Tax=Calliphora vicina TaxID=7373 RepID=UPI00325AD5A8